MRRRAPLYFNSLKIASHNLRHGIKRRGKARLENHILGRTSGELSVNGII